MKITDKEQEEIKKKQESLYEQIINSLLKK